MSMLYLRNKPIGAISGGASGGGHTIENPSGTDMTQRSNLQFTDADVADDSTNDRTEISIVRELMQAEFDELTPEEQNRGVIVIKDANPIYVPSDNAVSVTADGVKTYSQLLDELYALADQSKISKDSCLAINKEYHRLTDLRGIDYSFAGLNGQSLLIVRVKLRASNSAYEILSPNYSNASSSVPTSGATITLYYNIISTGLDAEIPAENVIYGDSNVKDALDELLDIENVTVTYPSIYVDTSKIKCFRCGKLVTISFVGAKLNTGVARYNAILQNVPTPANGAYVCNLLYGVAGSVTQTSVYINANATSAQVNDALSSGSELYGSLTYLTE